jgi:hypothetical protein
MKNTRLFPKSPDFYFVDFSSTGKSREKLHVFSTLVNTTQDFIVDIPKDLIDVHWFGRNFF